MTELRRAVLSGHQLCLHHAAADQEPRWCARRDRRPLRRLNW